MAIIYIPSPTLELNCPLVKYFLPTTEPAAKPAVEPVIELTVELTG